MTDNPFPRIEASGEAVPPSWALWERFLIDLMNRAAVEFVERYTRSDGTLIWRDEWPGMDGSDDGYESFASFPLFYALGGDERVHELSRKEWNSVTWQFTQYGQVYHEFDAYYDWMHHGEGSLYLYYFGLADPEAHADRRRALRFAGMYMGEDPEADNWDPQRKLIRSPINGSRGTRFEMTAEDWVTHRPDLARYLTPYEDVPGVDAAADPMAIADWNDDAVFAEILTRMNRRMTRGDVPLNLNATSLIANAYLYAGEEKYRRWVLEYLQAWCERAQANDGILPDNVGLSGRIGECIDGKWWGGYYGWRWPHGARTILEAALNAGANAVLMTGDLSHLDLVRSQLDLLESLGKVEKGILTVPKRHGDGGWFDYAVPDPQLYIHLYFLSQREEDRERLERLPKRDAWPSGGRFGKGAQYAPAPWMAYQEGRNPDYPEQVLAHTYQELCRRLAKIRSDDGDPREWDVHHWQDLNPVLCEPLLQLTMGSPGVIYHGGLCHARIRHFDPERRRPGLPAHVAALVERVAPESVLLSLVNTDPLQAHEVLLQAGAFGEHRFTRASLLGKSGGEESAIEVAGKYLQVRLGPAVHARLDLGMERFVHQPSYAFPWQPS